MGFFCLVKSFQEKAVIKHPFNWGKFLDVGIPNQVKSIHFSSTSVKKYSNLGLLKFPLNKCIKFPAQFI